ncbi:hypothetical protein [Phytohabitans aurantiacus]|uniref:Uncharacterized protein n=1 Tax=Phytohabitans aurantiacus TaxID=3016789 RepID=A0ABQ5R400_9ACTN|nr:hypothetical protein [Phytohabitans aurantiacus]GLI00680.1 hypothetical protein Pa4123_59560 [Phytohabitans aurantiacus]
MHDSADEFRLHNTRHLREGGSEFGGVPGEPQPYPHDLTGIEQLHTIYRSDTTDPDAIEIDTEQQAPSIGEL